MSTDGNVPRPEWDAASGQWVSGPYRWDAPSNQWVLRDPAAPGPQAQPVVPAAQAYAAPPAAQAYAAPSAPQPYAAQPSATPHAVQPPAPPAPKKKLGTGAIIAIVAGGVVVLLLVAALGIAALVRGAADPTAAPAEVVTDYFDALVAGDSAAALALVGAPPSDKTLLTDEMLAAAADAGVIDDVVVTVPEDADVRSRSVDLAVEYTIGGEPVSGTFTVTDYANSGDWSLTNGTVDVYLGATLEGLDATLNGIAFDSESVTLFPGAYTLETTNPAYALAGTTSALLPDPSDYASNQLDPTVELSDSGLATFQASITESVDACIASKNLVAGCGLDIPETLSDGTKVIDGTLTRTLAADAQAQMADLQPDELYGDPLLVTGPFIGGVDVTADCESEGQRYTGCTFVFMPSLGSPLVDFHTDPPVVRWDQ